MIFIKDEEFIRGEAPMTKEEVRILSIAKLRLDKGSRMLDVGAGTGSISIQAARLCREVVALEKEDEAIGLIRENMGRFSLDNISIIKGDAAETVATVQGEFDSIFIGGSGGSIEEIIRSCDSKLKEDGAMILNFVTIDNLYRAKEAMKSLDYSFDVTQVSISRSRGAGLMMMAGNPIFILCGTKNNRQEERRNG